MLRRAVLIAGAITVAGCYFFEPESPADARPLPVVDTDKAQTFLIDSARSSIQLKVYRDGLLQRLGHNHVIVVSQISGKLYRREPVSTSGFDLSFPVAAMIIDRPADRKRAGADFPGTIPEAHIRGTRENMLGPQMLQAERFPVIELRSLEAQGRYPRLTWRVAVKVRDQIAEISLPVSVQASGGQLIAQGAARLSQAALGLKPFCVLAGKLCVRDEIDAEFYLVAVSAPAD